jgi:hypothetical protein
MTSRVRQNYDSPVLAVTYSSSSSRFDDAGFTPDALFLRVVEWLSRLHLKAFLGPVPLLRAFPV